MENFEVHGYYTVSNCGGFEIMFSKCGEMAKIKDCYGSDSPKISDWLPIDYIENEDGDLDEDGYPIFEPIIDPQGYNISLSLVMRA